MKVQNISLKDINVTENVRMTDTDSEMPQLMESIKQHGLKEPIGVAEKDGKYLLLYGYRRYQAYKKLGYKNIPAVVGEEIELQSQLLINSIENIQRRNITPFELGRICHKLITLKMSPGEISARLNITKSTVSKALMVFNKVPAKWHNKIVFMGPGQGIERGKIAAHTVYKLIQMVKTAGLPEKETGELLECLKDERIGDLDINTIGALIKSGMNVKTALKRVNDYQNHRIDVIVNRKEMSILRKKYGSMQGVLRMAIYGIIEPLTKPDFIKFSTIEEK